MVRSIVRQYGMLSIGDGVGDKGMQSGNIIVVTGPSGAGKTTLVGALLKAESGVRLSISYTSRAKRPGEIDGQHYHFITTENFKERIQAGEFIEYAQIYQHYYGTSAKWLRQQLDESTDDMVLEIDYQGALQIQRLFPEAVCILILPPSLRDLSDRLHHRDTESPDVIDKRLAGATHEVSQGTHCRYLIVNQDIQQATTDLVSIVRAERLRMTRQSALLQAQYLS